MKWRQLTPQHLWEVLAFLATLLFIIAATFVSIHRFWQFEVFYYDFGIYDQAIRRLADFSTPVIDHYISGGKTIWADHFHPGILLLAPLYWLTSRSEVLLVVQAIAMGLSGYVIFWIAYHLLKIGYQSFAVLISYFLFIGVQNAVITDFHEVTIMALFLSLAYLAVVHQKKYWTIAFFLLMLSFKETFFLTGVGFAFFIFWYHKPWRKLAVGLGIGSFAYGILAMKAIIPFFSGGDYIYVEQYKWQTVFQSLVYPIIKLKTVFFLYWSFLFLPFLYVPTIPLVVLNLIPRFLSSASTRWDLGMHYNAEIAPTLAVSAILALVLIGQKFSTRVVTVIASLLLINSVFLYRFVLHGPLALAYNPAFSLHSQSFGFLERLVDQVPAGASVMTQNNLAVRFADRDVWLLRENYTDYMPEFILFDLREGQNPNNFYGADVVAIAQAVALDPQYVLVYHEGEQFGYKRVK